MRIKPFKKLPSDQWIIMPPSGYSNQLEPLRQWVLSELSESYFFPKEWLRERAELIDGTSETREVPKDFYGLCLTSSKGDPFLWVAIDPKGKAEPKLREALKLCPFSYLGLSVDGTLEGARALRQRANSDEIDILPDLETFSAPDRLRIGSPFIAPGGKGKNSQELELISSALEDVFFEAHSHIRDIDGLHADEALDELCKIIYAKLYDEEMTPAGKPYSLQRGLTGTSEEFAAIIRRTYREANEYDVRVFSLKIPGYDRSRGVFNSDMRLTTPALAKVAATLEPYWLTRSSIDVKGRAFQRVLGPSLRSGMGQYFTPQEVITMMVDVAQPTVTDLILDPFSGSGHFLTRSLDTVRNGTKHPDEKRLNEFAFNKLHGIEKSDRMVRIAMTDMRLHGDGHSNIRCTDALLDFQNYPDLRPESFDLILTNPPFGSILGPEAISRLGRFALSDGRRNVPLEILGLERCVQFIRPGGRLGIVLPDGVLVNRQAAYVREWLATHMKVRAIVSLPIATFSPFGANIKTSVLFARKWKSGERKTENHAVHLSRIDNIGYEPTGRKVEGSEMAAATSGLQEFLKKEGW